MGLLKVIHKVRAYIDGRTYNPGEIAEIDERDFAAETHDLVDEEGKVIAEIAPPAEPFVAPTETNENTPTDAPAPVPERASNFVLGSPTVEEAPQSEPTPPVEKS